MHWMTLRTREEEPVLPHHQQGAIGKRSVGVAHRKSGRTPILNPNLNLNPTRTRTRSRSRTPVFAELALAAV